MSDSDETSENGKTEEFPVQQTIQPIPPPAPSAPEPPPATAGVEALGSKRLVEVAELAERGGVPRAQADGKFIRSFLAQSKGEGDGLVIDVPQGGLKASQAQHMIEVWMMPVEETHRTITRTIVTMLWVNGEAMGPGGDQMIFECPGGECTGLFYPGFPIFMPNQRLPPPLEGSAPRVPYVICGKCHRPYPRADLIDRRAVTGTYDVLGRHLTFRFHQVGCDADILKRILHENMHRPVPDMLNKERGATDRYLHAQSHRDYVYFFVNDIMAETAKGVDTDRLFANFIRA